MLAAIHRPPAGNQDQLRLPLIDNWPLSRSSPPGHVSPCGSTEVAFKGRNVREKDLGNKDADFVCSYLSLLALLLQRLP